MKYWTITLTVHNDSNSDGVPLVEEMPIASYGIANFSPIATQIKRLEEIKDETMTAMYENGKALMFPEVDMLNACIKHLKELKERKS